MLVFNLSQLPLHCLPDQHKDLLASHKQTGIKQQKHMVQILAQLLPHCITKSN